MTARFRTYVLLALALGPLIIALAASHALWGSGEVAFAFWKHWKYLLPTLTNLVQTVTDWGNPLAYVVYAFVLLFALRAHRRDDLRLVLWYIAVQLCIALALTYVLKNAFGMPRPFTGETEPHPWAFEPIYQSFPSGHTTENVGAVLPLALWRRRMGDAALCGVWIAAVAYSRVYLGRHYLMDVWGGLALGCLSAFLILHLARKRT